MAAASGGRACSRRSAAGYTAKEETREVFSAVALPWWYADQKQRGGVCSGGEPGLRRSSPAEGDWELAAAANRRR